MGPVFLVLYTGINGTYNLYTMVYQILPLVQARRRIKPRGKNVNRIF